MFIDEFGDPRTDPPARADERATLTLFLPWHRGNEEYARHNGHADLLRQRIDGAVEL